MRDVKLQGMDLKSTDNSLDCCLIQIPYGRTWKSPLYAKLLPYRWEVKREKKQ